MARQLFAVVAALALFAATAGLVSAADAPSPSSGSRSVFSYSGVPVSGPVSADDNVVGSIDSSDMDSGAPIAAGPGVSEDVVPGPLGGPVPEGTFGPIDTAEGPSASAATAVPAVAGAAVAAVAASFFF